MKGRKICNLCLIFFRPSQGTQAIIWPKKEQILPGTDNENDAEVMSIFYLAALFLFLLIVLLLLILLITMDSLMRMRMCVCVLMMLMVVDARPLTVSGAVVLLNDA